MHWIWSQSNAFSSCRVKQFLKDRETQMVSYLKAELFFLGFDIDRMRKKREVAPRLQDLKAMQWVLRNIASLLIFLQNLLFKASTHSPAIGRMLFYPEWWGLMCFWFRATIQVRGWWGETLCESTDLICDTCINSLSLYAHSLPDDTPHSGTASTAVTPGGHSTDFRNIQVHGARLHLYIWHLP